MQAAWRGDPLHALVVCKRVADVFTLPAALVLYLADEQAGKGVVHKGEVLDPGKPGRHRLAVDVKTTCVGALMWKELAGGC